jgi:alanyl-tRNA synthetase
MLLCVHPSILFCWPLCLQLTAEVDQSLRRRIRAHHTATHLLQSALKQVLGPDTCQQGSLVEAGRLR